MCTHPHPPNNPSSATENWVVIGSDNGLAPVGDKPVSKPMMTSHQSHPKEQTSMKRYRNWQFLIDEIALKFIILNSSIVPPYLLKGDTS